MMDIIQNNRSEPLNQAFQLMDDFGLFMSIDMLPTNPSQAGALDQVDGVWRAGHDGAFAAQRLFLLPYCNGQPGTNFSMRIYGWRGIDNNAKMGQTGTSYLVWVPYLLAEFACISCNRFGPPSTNPPGGVQRLIPPSYAMCDTITLTQGALGLTGEIDSTGPGTDLIAFAILELRGSRYFQFDFNATDPNVLMNCLWARA